MFDIPCRASSDLREKQRLEDQADSQTFNLWDDKCLREILPPDLAPHIQTILCMAQTMKVDAYLKHELDALYAACVQRWKDQ